MRRTAVSAEASGSVPENTLPKTSAGSGRGHGRIVRSAFRPHPLFANPHLQTILPALLRPLPVLPMRIQRLELPDGDFVDLAWSGGHRADGPICVLVHGLGGGFQSKYLRGLAARLVARGWRCVMLQLRGGGLEPNRLPRSYHHGDTQDLRHVWQLLRSQNPRAPLASVGWSLGGNVLLRALGEEGAEAPVDVAAAVSTPFRLRECAEFIRTGFSRVYQNHLLAVLRDMVRRKQAACELPPTVDVPAALAARDFIEFDDAYTAPLNGYDGAYDYYERAACGPMLRHIRRPTRIVHALDDPFMVPEVVPLETQLSPDVTLELAAHGGHVGFIGMGSLGQPAWWLEQHLERYLVETLAPQGQSQNDETAPEFSAA